MSEQQMRAALHVLLVRPSGQNAKNIIDLHGIGIDDNRFAAGGTDGVGQGKRQSRLAAGRGPGYQDRVGGQNPIQM